MRNHSSIEVLENRIAPAGVIGTFFDPATKSLTLTGDAAANEVTIVETAPGVLVLLQTGGTQFEPRDAGGLPTGPASFEPQRFTGFAGNLTISLLGDADLVQILGLSKVRDVSINTGAGADRIKLNNVTVGGSLTVTDSADTNDYTAENLVVKGGISWTGGTGNDTYRFSGGLLTVGGNFTVDDAAGDNSLLVEAADTKIGGAFSYLGSNTGADTVTFTGVSLKAKSMNVSTFNGDSGFNVILAESWNVAGNVTISSGVHTSATHTVQVPVLKVGGDFSISSSTGPTSLGMTTTTVAIKGQFGLSSLGQAGMNSSAFLNFGNASFGTVDLNLGLGINNVTVQTAGKITAQSLIYTGGLNTDNINVVAGLLAVKDVLDLTTGAAADLVIINAAMTAGRVQLDLGTGADSFSWNSIPFRGAKSAIKTSFNVALGDGMDFFGLSAPSKSAISVGGGFLINADDTLASGENISINGLKALNTFSITSSSKFSAFISNLTVGRAAVFDALDAQFTRISGSKFLDTVLFNGGSNADNISISEVFASGDPAPMSFAKAVTINLFGGADNVTIGGPVPFGIPTFKGAVTIDGGAAVDTVNIGTNAVFLAGVPTQTNVP